jgi:uncharacterized protein with PIN domain
MAICPYCDKDVTLNKPPRGDAREVDKEIKGTLKKEVMYSCPHCGKILGFGFFIGGLLTDRP